MIQYVDDITPEEYLELRKKVGWMQFPLEEARNCVENAYMVRAVRDEGRAVGVVRLLWDGGYVAFLSDVIVDPAYQGRGIGRTLVEAVIARIKKDMKPGYKVKLNLNSAKGKEPFYKKFGFEERPNDNAGAGMDQWLTIEEDSPAEIPADAAEREQDEEGRAVQLYSRALQLLDRYDHQTLEKPEGNPTSYRVTFEDCRNLISRMEGDFRSDVFGMEKEPGKVEGILAAVYQDVFGGEVYPTLEEKAANLLYCMIKDHPFADGCKRIAASLFLEFLEKNHALFRDGQKVISDGTLVAMTLMIAESRPDEKDIMTKMVMNLLTL